MAIGYVMPNKRRTALVPRMGAAGSSAAREDRAGGRHCTANFGGSRSRLTSRPEVEIDDIFGYNGSDQMTTAHSGRNGYRGQDTLQKRFDAVNKKKKIP